MKKILTFSLVLKYLVNKKIKKVMLNIWVSFMSGQNSLRPKRSSKQFWSTFFFLPNYSKLNFILVTEFLLKNVATFSQLIF